MKEMTARMAAQAEIELIKQVKLNPSMCTELYYPDPDDADVMELGCVMERYAAYHNLTTNSEIFVDNELVGIDVYDWEDASTTHLGISFQWMREITCANDDGNNELAWNRLEDAIVNRIQKTGS